MLTIYFARILVVVLLWYPAIGCMMAIVHSLAPAAIGIPFVFVQSIVSAAMSLTKTDIKDAVVGQFHRLACWSSATVSPHSPRDMGSSKPGRAVRRSNTLASFGFGAFIVSFSASRKGRSSSNRSAGGTAPVAPSTG